MLQDYAVIGLMLVTAVPMGSALLVRRRALPPPLPHPQKLPPV